MSRHFNQIQALGTGNQIERNIKYTLKTLREGLNNTANTKEGTDGQN